MFKNVYLKKTTCLMLMASILTVTTLSGCGGQSARTVDRYMPGDEDKSCSVLLAEISVLEDEIVAKDQEKGSRDFWNVLNFIGGVLIIVPFFFMDTKGSEEIEMDALKARQKMLKVYFADKNCSIVNPSVTPVAQ